MVRYKWILLIITSITFNSSLTYAQSALSADDLELEQRIIGSVKPTIQTQQKAQPRKITLSELLSFLRKGDANLKNCIDSKKIPFAEKYILTYDATGNPCRIYDLSFPNLRSVLKSVSFFQVPLRNLTSKDFLNALDNDWDSIQARNQRYRFGFNPKTAAKNSFLSTLKFKNRPQMVGGSQMSSADIGLPKSFTLADLELNARLELPASTKAQMTDLLNELEADHLVSGEKANQIRQFFLRVLNTPETILAGVKFNWNDLNKAYDVIIEGDFLPLMGPVEVINFQKQYKGTVEKLFRGILGGILSGLPRLIPNRTVSAVVEVVVEDLFEQIDTMYDYQINRLEGTLKNLKDYSLNDADLKQLEERALNILYGQKSDLLSSYLMAVAQGGEFDWQAFEKLGRTNRYNIEKQRQIMMDKTHSKLVLEKKCKTEIVNEYFAVCYKNGMKEGLYSLITEQTIPFKTLGAPLIHRYKRPYEVPFIRGGTWLLSVGLRIVGLPLSRAITNQLNSYLKSFMRAGVLDEAYLQNGLYASHIKGQATLESQKLLSWLYVQNMNPFMPKTLQFENSIIKANKSLLGIN